MVRDAGDGRFKGIKRLEFASPPAAHVAHYSVYSKQLVRSGATSRTFNLNTASKKQDLHKRTAEPNPHFLDHVSSGW